MVVKLIVIHNLSTMDTNIIKENIFIQYLMDLVIVITMVDQHLHHQSITTKFVERNNKKHLRVLFYCLKLKCWILPDYFVIIRNSVYII